MLILGDNRVTTRNSGETAGQRVLNHAHRYAPRRFKRLMLPTVSVDDAFLHGTGGIRRKLTTDLNDADCMGQWLVFVESEEAVGRATS